MKTQKKKIKMHVAATLTPGMTSINHPKDISSTAMRFLLLVIRVYKIVNVPQMERIDASFIKAIWKAVAIQASWLEIICISETNLMIMIVFNLCLDV